MRHYHRSVAPPCDDDDHQYELSGVATDSTNYTCGSSRRGIYIVCTAFAGACSCEWACSVREFLSARPWRMPKLGMIGHIRPTEQIFLQRF